LRRYSSISHRILQLECFWTSLIVDTNGNGKRDDYTEPGQPLDPNKDMRIGQTVYAVMPDPKDGSIWGSLWESPAGW
jgi:hypothetical protein